ncbi:unnamed protein product [Sphagnum troendelagicum]|uniref:Uncharacterized protein n=1 Tax=Sphagnum troendelagicum TaxID=128251 RepID=A0ABP0TKE4_9BRYO
MAGGGGSSPHVVAVKLSAASQAAVSDSWTDSKLLSGDIVLQVSTDSGAEFRAPFAGGKAGLQREFRKLTNARGGWKVKVKRGQTILDVWVKVALDESSLLKKNYVLVSLLDATHVATLVDSIEQECIDLQEEYSKKGELLLRMNSMRLKESNVAYPWEQKLQTHLPVSGSATVFSLLVMPVALSPKARDYAGVEDTSARAVAWLSAAQESGVPISFVNIQTEPLFLQVGHPVVTTKLKFGCYRQDPVNIANSGCYRLQNREAMDMDVVRAVRLWYMPAGAEFAIELRPEENEARLGVGISCTEEGFCYVSSVDPGTVADRAGLLTLYQGACEARKLLVVSRLGREKITPWLVSSGGSIRCFDTVSMSDKLSLHRQTGESVKLHVMLWDGALHDSSGPQGFMDNPSGRN